MPLRKNVVKIVLYLNLVESLTNSKDPDPEFIIMDPDPGGQFFTDQPDPNSQH